LLDSLLQEIADAFCLGWQFHALQGVFGGTNLSNSPAEL